VCAPRSDRIECVLSITVPPEGLGWYPVPKVSSGASVRKDTLDITCVL
jgi:hypothetical protein